LSETLWISFLFLSHLSNQTQPKKSKRETVKEATNTKVCKQRRKKLTKGLDLGLELVQFDLQSGRISIAIRSDNLDALLFIV
jgi:hypothetical protein